ncbi:MAG: prepilin-type N-terminal cleavage/methylation domain-containing protein [Patescibacteria group bacterium]|nr:prepilin-type N-terminal cleavage/methylation domain-containing protein [Patescibacteria group bacterium]MDD5295167.1 prepilin-type N-terminal cleavage/methylation domain-containing protein [Patescibacteria group bacterium]MDD5554768.1 prepilin-type N-terminal cleavage/methylation domain-containing protein [Patescibacteria group bacterium]
MSQQTTSNVDKVISNGVKKTNLLGFTPSNTAKGNLMGFTLIELLVVISIIGILASFSVVSLNGARIKARDAKRKADMVQMRIALYLYYDDNLEYPQCGTWDDEADDFGATAECYNGTLNISLTERVKPYMAELPIDPKNEGIYTYRYVSSANGSEFVLAYNVEESAEVQIIRGW